MKSDHWHIEEEAKKKTTNNTTMEKAAKDDDGFCSNEIEVAEASEKLPDQISFDFERQISVGADDHEETVPKADDKYNVPKDRGWSWFVMLGALLEMTLVVGTLKTGGIIFVAFLERFQSSSSLTSLLSTIQNATYSLSAPLVLCIGTRLASSRTLLFIGTLLLSTAFIITSQAKDIRVLFLSHGILQGLATSFMQPVTIVTLASYFDKKRGFANSLAVSGGSLGSLIFAPLYTYLLREYGYQGCFLIIAGFLLNGLVVSALFRPHSFYKVRTRTRTRTPIVKGHTGFERKPLMTQISVTSNGERANGTPTKIINGNGLHINGNGSDIGSKNSLSARNNGNANQELPANLPAVFRKRTMTESSQKSQLPNKHLFNSLTNLHHGSMEYMCGSMLDINLKPIEEQNSNLKDDHNKKDSDGGEEAKQKMTLKSMIKLLISSFDFKLFKNPIFCILQLASFLICGNSALLTVYVAPHGRDIGLSADQIALIVTVFSSTDFLSRIVIALVADRGWIRRSNITATSIFIVGVASNLMRFYSTFNVLMVYAVILGLFSGVYFSLFAVLIVDYLTIHKLQAAFGFTSLFHGAGVSLFYYVIGQLRDVTGSYIVPFHIMGCLCMFGGLLHFSLPVVERYQKKREGVPV